MPQVTWGKRVRPYQPILSATFPTANLQLDLDARVGLVTTAAGSTPAVNDADPVGKWTDNSGNARVVNQATAGSRPILKLNQVNGLPSVRFDGTDDELTAPAFVSSDIITNTTYELFAVINATTISSNNSGSNIYLNDPIIGDSGGYWGLNLRSTPTAQLFNYVSPYADSPVSISTGAWILIHARHDTGNLIISKDGGSEGSVASGNTQSVTNPVRLGAAAGLTEWFAGDISRILVYNALMSSGVRASTIAYLKSLYGIA